MSQLKCSACGDSDFEIVGKELYCLTCENPVQYEPHLNEPDYEPTEDEQDFYQNLDSV